MIPLLTDSGAGPIDSRFFGLDTSDIFRVFLNHSRPSEECVQEGVHSYRAATVRERFPANNPRFLTGAARNEHFLITL